MTAMQRSHAPRGGGDVQPMNDVKSLLQLVHTHRMQHEQGAYDAASSATIQRCKTMLVKLRKLLPKLMRPIATLPRDAATPMLRDLCQLMDALLQGSVCPHTMTLFLEDPVEDPAKLAGADYASCSYPTVATMIIYMVSFYSNPSLRDAHDNVLHVIVQLLLLVERTDVHGFRHFFHDTALLLQDCFLLEEHLKIHREIQESDLNVTISCFVDSAIHVYQGTDGPLGSKSKTRLCGCVPIEDHQQLTERRVQLQGMLPPIQVTSFHNLIMLRRSIVRMVDLLVQECGGVLRSSPAFVDLVRLLPLLLRSDRARLESVSSFSPVVPKDESLEVAKSSLKLFHTVLQTDLESEGALVDLIQAFLRSSMIKSSHDLIAEHAQVVDVLSSLFRLQPNTVMELIWPPMRQWLAEGSECILDVGAAHCAVFLSSVLRMLPLFLTNSDSVIIDPVIRFVTQLELAYVCDNVASDVVKLLLRILSFKSLSLKFFHVMAKILTTPAHYDEPEATSLKRKRDEGILSEFSSHESNGSSRESPVALQKPAEEVLGTWLMRQMASSSATMRGLSVTLRVMMPFRSVISKTVRTESFSIHRALVDRISAFATTTLTDETSVSLPVELQVLMLLHLENHELLKLGPAILNANRQMESKQYSESLRDDSAAQLSSESVTLQIIHFFEKSGVSPPDEPWDGIAQSVAQKDQIFQLLDTQPHAMRCSIAAAMTWHRLRPLKISLDNWSESLPAQMFYRAMCSRQSEQIQAIWASCAPICLYLLCAPNDQALVERVVPWFLNIFAESLQSPLPASTTTSVLSSSRIIMCLSSWLSGSGEKGTCPLPSSTGSRSFICCCQQTSHSLPPSAATTSLYESLISTRSGSAQFVVDSEVMATMSAFVRHIQFDKDQEPSYGWVGRLMVACGSASIDERQHAAEYLGALVGSPQLLKAISSSTSSAVDLEDMLNDIVDKAESAHNEDQLCAAMVSLGSMGEAVSQASKVDHVELLAWLVLRLLSLWNKGLSEKSRLQPVAFDQLRRITSAWALSWRRMCVEYPDLMYFPLVDNLLSANSLKMFLRTFMGSNVDTSVFLSASAPYVLPAYVVGRNEQMLHAFVAEYNGQDDEHDALEDGSEGDHSKLSSVTEMLLNHIEFVLKEMILHQVQAENNENRIAEWEFLFRFLPENSTIRDVISHSPLRLLNHLAWELGGSRSSMAKKAFREVCQYLNQETTSRPGDLMHSDEFSMPRQHFLALLTDLGNKIGSKSSNTSINMKTQAIKSLHKLFALFKSSDPSKPSSHGVVDAFVPKVMAIVKIGLGEQELQDCAVVAWDSYVRMLSVKALESSLPSIVVSLLPCMGYDPMKLIIEGDNSGQGWLVDQLHFESVAETTQTQASDLCKTTAINLLKYLFRERGNELKHAFPRIPMLPAVSELDEVYVAIASEIGDPSTQQISKFLPGVVSYVNHWDSAVREVVLVQLLRCLVVRSSELHSMLQSDGNIYIDQAIVDLVLSILQLARTETQPTIKQLCARVLGALGAIDGARIPLSMFYMSNSSQGREKVDSRMEHSTKDLACVLIENWLVKELRAAPENTDAVAFAIQELLKFLTELTADSGQNGHPTSGAGSQMPEWMKKRFERKEKDVLQFVEPYWSTNYVISNPRHQRNHGSDSVDRALHPGVDDITFYEKYGATYEDWLLAWSKRLIHLSQAPERKIFLACRTALPSCPQMARFLLPYLIQNVLRSGNPEIYEEVKREVLAVLNDHERVIETEPRGTSSASTSSENNNERRLGEVLSRHHQCAQAIFSTFDELHEWIWISEKKRLALSASASRQSGSTRTIDVPSEMDDHEKENVEEFLKDIPSRSLSNAAFDIKAFARAIQYFEVYLRQQHVPPVDGKESANHSLACPVSLDIISKNATYLQLLYSNVEEPDYLTGLATLRRLFDAQRHHDGTQDRPMDDGLNLMDLMHQIVDHEQLAQWEDALACYEQAIQEIQSALSSRSFHPSRARHTRDSSLRYADGEIEADPETIKPELYTGVVRCLIQLGRLESALQHINGIVTQEPDYLATLYPFALECSWRLSRWDLLSDLLNSEQQNPLVLNSNSLGNMANVTRTRSGVDVSKLMLVRVVHSLHEGDIASFTKHLNAARLEIMGPLAAASAESYQRAYPLLHQLHFLHEAEQGFIAITKAKNQNIRDRKMLWKSQCAWEPRYEVLATALKFRDPILALRRVMLQELNLRQDVSFNWLRYAKLARKEGHLRTATSAVMHAEALDNQYASLQKAKLMVAQDRMYEALQILEPVDLDASKLVFDVDDPHFCAKNLLLATNWMQESGQRQGKKVIERYNAVIKFDPKWEKGYFYLAKYYEYLLSVTHPDARNEEALVVDSVFHTQLINLMKNYVLALKYGTKFLFQSMPRLLTLWFEYGEVFFSSTSRGSKTTKAMRHIELGMSQSSTEQQILTDINQVIEDALEQLPAYEWLVCFPQVISRICHPTPMVVEGVKKVMVKVLCAYPTQAMWPILGLSRSLNSQRRNRARDIISNAQRHFVSQGEQEVANSFSEGMRLVEELIALAGHDPGAQRRIHIRLSRIRTKILVPVQAALTTVLHSAGLAPSDSQHSAFADSGQVYIKSFSDKADVMMTKEKPKRVEVMGSDGNLYPFLCKREKTGDLRKDARMMEFNSMINKLLQKDPEGRRRKLRVRTYAVVCLNEESGMMEWVRNTKAMRQLIGQIHKTERGYIQPVRLTHEIKERFLGMQKKYADNIPTMALYYRRKILTLPAFTPRFHQWFYNNFADPTAWFESRLAFARSAAVWSMVGHIIGLGDRHGENILIDCTNGECVHVDFDCLFDKGLKLAKPEIVPFRLTPNMIDAFGITGYEGVFRRVCEVTMRLLRENKETLRSVLESFIHDPLVEWGRRGKTAQGSSGSGARGITDIAADRSKEETRIILKTIDDRLRGIYNLGDAVRPLLSSSHRSILPENDTLPLSVQGQVDKLIHEAVSHENLAQMYIGWMPFL